MTRIVSLLGEMHAGFRDVDAMAALHSKDQLSFASLYFRSSALAQEIVGSRHPVLIRGVSSVQILVAIWACLLTGRPYIMIEPEIPSQRVHEIAKTCGASLLLIAEQGDDLQLGGVETRPIHNFNRETDGFAPVSRGERDVAYILFSSGTTGHPKGIQVAYNNLAHFVDWLDSDLLNNDQSLAVTGNVRYCFDVSLFEMWYSWLRRIPMSVLNNADFVNSRLSISRYSEHRVGLWVSTPSTLRLYLRDKMFSAETLPDLKTFLLCGEVLPKAVVAAVFERFPGARVINTYGPTECTVAVTSVEIKPEHLQAKASLPIGKPRQGCELSVKDGQIVIKGCDVVGLGYVGLPERTAQAFPVPDTYLTGDIGHLDENGQWAYCGRSDREIKLQGVRVDLNEVEAAIREIPGIETAHVAPHLIRSNIRAMNAYVCGPKSLDDLSQAALQMASALPPWMVPRFWYACPGFPMNRNSKLDQNDLMRNAELEGLRYVYG